MATRAQLVEELLQLPSTDRAHVARELLESLDGNDDPKEVEAAWQYEIKQRVREIERGSVELKDGPTVMNEARARLKARRTSDQ